MDDEQQPAEEAQPADPMQILQNAISQVADADSFCAGFAVVCEWLEGDGSRSLQVFHTPMPPWHLQGLLSYAQDAHCTPLVAVSDLEEWDEDD